MGVGPSYLLDTSAFARLTHEPTVAAVIRPLLVDGAVAVSAVLSLEAGYSARNAREHRRVGELLGTLPQATIEPVDWVRASEVQGLLAQRGTHRSAGLADLLVAASAERYELEVLHYDADFDQVAAVTGQRVRWVVPRGSLTGVGRPVT